MCDPPEPAKVDDFCVGDTTVDNTTNNKSATFVKKELKDCVICLNRNCELWHDLLWTETTGRRIPIVTFVCRVAEVRLSALADAAGGYICETCFELINLLEQSEIEYLRLKDNIVAILSNNTFFDKVDSENNEKKIIDIIPVKNETDGAAQNLSVEFEHLVENQQHKEPSLKRKRDRKQSKRKEQKSDIQFSDPEDDTTLLQLKEENEKQMNQRSSKLLNEDDDDNFDWTDAPIFSNEQNESSENLKRKSRTRKVKEKEPKDIRRDDEDASVLERRLNEKSNVEIKKATKYGKVNKERRKIEAKPKKTYTCKECHAVFNKFGQYKFHLTEHENSSKPPYICEVCGAHYKKKKACDIHVAMHKGIGDWKCEECDRLFPSKAALNRHNNIHTRTLNYQCDLCGKSFIHTSSFKMHKLSHSGLKPHSCEICGLALLTKSHLKRHKRIHTGEKRHECATCGKKFSERYNMLAHQKSHGIEEAPKMPRPKLNWSGFHCHLCEKRFIRKYLLEKHMEVVHQRIMERSPGKPRNTMTKLLKAQAAAVRKLSVRTDLGEQGAGGHGAGAQGTLLKNILIVDKATEMASKSTPSNAEEAPVDVKTEKPLKKDDPETASTSDRSTTYEAYDALRSANGAWPPNQYIPVEYLRSLPELQQ